MQIPWDFTSTVIYGKEDINKDCKFICKDSNDFTWGYGCKIRYEKRKMNRCKKCLFGIHY